MAELQTGNALRRISCPHCRQTFVGKPAEGNTCSLCGKSLSAAPVPQSEKAIARPSAAKPTLAFAAPVLIAACLGGMAAGYYGYAQHVSAGDAFVIWLWFAFLPAAALSRSWRPGKLFDWSSRALVAAPYAALLGFWLVYRHPDLWSAGMLTATASLLLCAAAFALGSLTRRWRRRWVAKARWPHWLIRIIAVAYSITMIAFLAVPLDVQYKLHSLKYKGQGVLNAASTDVSISRRDDQGRLVMYVCDRAVRDDLMGNLAGAGYSGMARNLTSAARKQRRGLLFGILPIRDRGLLGSTLPRAF